MRITPMLTAHFRSSSSADTWATGVLANEISALWARVEPMIARGLGSEETTDQVLECLLLKLAQLWTVMEGDDLKAVVVTEICILKDGSKVCNVWAAAGSGINRWLGYMATIEAWAKENGCRAVVVDRARIGWRRLMRDYKITHVTLEKEI